MIKMTKDEPDESCYEKQGLSDGGIVLLNCNVCAKPLLNIWIVNPNFKFKDGSPYKYNYKATCPYCGNGSDIKEVEGDVRFLNIVKELPLEDGEVKEVQLTTYGDIIDKREQNLCIIQVLIRKPKVKKNG